MNSSNRSRLGLYSAGGKVRIQNLKNDHRRNEQKHQRKKHIGSQTMRKRQFFSNMVNWEERNGQSNMATCKDKSKWAYWVILCVSQNHNKLKHWNPFGILCMLNEIALFCFPRVKILGRRSDKRLHIPEGLLIFIGTLSQLS